MKALLAAYSSKSGDGQGYRWLWHSPQLSESLLGACYGQLDTAAFSFADGLKKLTPNHLNGGLFSVDEKWCAGYRFLHGGRDGTREKFYLITVFFERQFLSNTDLSGLWHSAIFSEVLPSLPVPLDLPVKPASSLGPTAQSGLRATQEFSGTDSLQRALRTCAALPMGQFFHLRLQGDLVSPLGKLECGPPPVPPSVSPPSQQARISPSSLSPSRLIEFDSANPAPTKSRGVRAFVGGIFVGMMVGACVGFIIARRSTEPEVSVKYPPPRVKRGTNSVLDGSKLKLVPPPAKTPSP